VSSAPPTCSNLSIAAGNKSAAPTSDTWIYVKSPAYAGYPPYLPLPSFRKRDWARARLVELVEGIIQRRRNLEKEPRWQYVAE